MKNNEQVIHSLDIVKIEINYILSKVEQNIEEKEKINQEKCDADIKFNTLNLDDIISQVNNNNNIFNSFDNIILSNSFNSFTNNDNQTKKEPIKINNIEELLLNEEQITEIIYTYDIRYKDCFNESNIIKLIDYSTHMAYISDDEISTHKYPFYSCELLKCDAPYIYEYFFNNDRIISYFFEFLNDSKNNSNCVLSGYFTKIFLSLLDKKSDEIINFIFKEDNMYIERIIELCENSSYCECIKNLLILQSSNYDDKKLFIIQSMNKKIFRKEEFTNKVCFEIYSPLLEEGNLIFCNFILRKFEKIYINYKHKSLNIELFYYYIHLVRIIKECFTREKENNIDISRKDLNTYVIKNKIIFLDFEISLIDSLTDVLFIQNSIEDNLENKSYRRIIVSYLDILEYVIFTVSIKDENKETTNNTKDFNYYINKIHDIFTTNILTQITNVIYKYPLFNMLQVSYIKLFSTLAKINSPLLNNDVLINKFIDNITNESDDKNILLSFLVKILQIIYLSQEEQGILYNKKLKYSYDLIIKNIMNIFDSKLLFNQEYGYEVNNTPIISEDIDTIKVEEEKTPPKENKDNNITDNQNSKEQNLNIDKCSNKDLDENNSSLIPTSFQDVVNKGIFDYTNKIRICSSYKNLNSAENISEEIDLDDINDDDLDDDKKGGDKNFTLTSFDEIDEEDNINNGNESINEIFKQTVETIKSIKLRNNELKEKKKVEKFEIKNEKDNKREELMLLETNKINDILKNKGKSKNLFLFDRKTLPIINSDKSSMNPEISNKVKVKSIFDFSSKNKNKNNNNKNLNILPKIKINTEEQEHSRYIYRYNNTLSRTTSNLTDRINNFRSNNIIKSKDIKEMSLFNNLRKSSENEKERKFFMLNNINIRIDK